MAEAKGTREKPFLHISTCVLRFPFILFAFLHSTRNQKKCTNCKANVRNSNQFQYCLNVLRFSTKFSLSLIRLYFDNIPSTSVLHTFHFYWNEIAIDLRSTVDYWCTCEHLLYICINRMIVNSKPCTCFNSTNRANIVPPIRRYHFQSIGNFMNQNSISNGVFLRSNEFVSVHQLEIKLG